MSSIEPWGTSQEGSAARENKMTVPHLSGDDIAALNKSEFGLVKCIEDGSSFLINHLYMSPADPDDDWIDVTSLLAHTHLNDSDGGELTDLFVINSDFMVAQWLTKAELLKAHWDQATASGGTIEDFDNGTENSIRLHTGTTNGASAQIIQRHTQLNWSHDSIFQAKVELQQTSNIAIHAGVSADDITAADTNTKKYAFEICTTLSPPANANWNVRTANGSDKSISDIGEAFTLNRTGLTLWHLPDESPPRVDAYLALADTTFTDVFEKNTFIPVSGNTNSNNFIRFGIKNSTNSDRHLIVYGARVTYKVQDEWY